MVSPAPWYVENSDRKAEGYATFLETSCSRQPVRWPGVSEHQSDHEPCKLDTVLHRLTDGGGACSRVTCGQRQRWLGQVALPTPALLG